MSLKGSAAIVGFGELPSQRIYPGRSTLSLCAEAAATAIADARLRKDEIDAWMSARPAVYTQEEGDDEQPDTKITNIILIAVTTTHDALVGEFAESMHEEGWDALKSDIVYRLDSLRGLAARGYRPVVAIVEWEGESPAELAEVRAHDRANGVQTGNVNHGW